MAKRAALTFDAMKVAKGAPAPSEAPPPAPAAAAPEAAKRGRGRPAKRPEGVKLYGMTLAFPATCGAPCGVWRRTKPTPGARWCLFTT